MSLGTEAAVLPVGPQTSLIRITTRSLASWYSSGVSWAVALALVIDLKGRILGPTPDPLTQNRHKHRFPGWLLGTLKFGSFAHLAGPLVNPGLLSRGAQLSSTSQWHASRVVARDEASGEYVWGPEECGTFRRNESDLNAREAVKRKTFFRGPCFLRGRGRKGFVFFVFTGAMGGNPQLLGSSNSKVQLVRSES